MLTDEQKVLRRGFIGGSDASAICGLNQYRTPLEVWNEKVHGLYKEVDNYPVVFGNLTESYVLQKYLEQSGNTLKHLDSCLFHSKDHSFLGGNVDGIVIKPDGTFIVVELKTAGLNTMKEWGSEGSDEIPTNYLMQAAHYSMITGLDVDIAVMSRDNGNLKIYHYRRDLALEKNYLKKALKFWEHVQTKNPPAASTYRERVSQVYFNTSEEVLCLATPEALETYNAIKANNSSIDALDKLNDQLKIYLLNKMDNSTILKNTEGKTLAKCIETTRITYDTKKMQQDSPDFIKGYAKTTTFKSLRII